MNKVEYLEHINTEVDELLKDNLLSNYKNQIFAWRLNASFNKTFKEDYLWNRAIFLSSNCSLLLQNSINYKTAMIGLKTSAEIFEYLSELPDIKNLYDKDYLLLLSSLCYDLSGYQANAYCIASRIDSFSFQKSKETILIETDDIIVKHITYILLKKIPQSKFELNNDINNNDLGNILFVKALTNWYNYIFKLSDNNFIQDFDNAYEFYLNKGNTFVSQVIFLLKTRILTFIDRSIWNKLKDNIDIKENLIWKKYVKLLAFDFYSNNSIKELDQRKSVFEFWTSQIRAIENGLLELDENFVVQMPTSAGKTFIAELAILKNLIKFPNKKCIYIAPFRALTSEKEVELAIYFSKLGYSVSSLSGSYEVDDFQEVILSETDLLIATPEKIDLLLRINPDFFNSISFIVVDEGHIIGDLSSRAMLLEFLIIRLRIKIPLLKTLFISAVMPPSNADEYSLWLSGKKENVLRALQFEDSSVNDEWEPTRKLIGSFYWEGNNGKIGFKNFDLENSVAINESPFIPYFLTNKEFGNSYPNKNDKLETTAALAYKLSFEGNTLVFCSQPRHTEWVFLRMKNILNVINNDEIPNWFLPNEKKQSFHYSKIWYGEDYYISEAIKYGIGIHFGDMPEQVRNAVEYDYRNGNLKVLLSSNTVGQGLNFPIKNLIFHSVSIGFNKKPINVSNRDFWNIVGRAGRAGKETEGKIIFVINSISDLRIYNNYIDKSNIENADSLLFKVLEVFGADRIKLDNFTSLLSETYLLDMITEEIIGTDYEEIINEIINNSLFKIQLDKRNIDIQPLKDAFKKVFKKIEENSTLDQIEAYKLTGFSFKSNMLIDEFIESQKEVLFKLIKSNDYLKTLNIFLDFILSNEIQELKDDKLNKLEVVPEVYKSIIFKWISGTPVEELLVDWKNNIGEINGFHILLSKGLYYLYPWGLSAFLNILSYKLKIELKEFPDDIRNATSYLKFGLNNATSCLARSLGIKNRTISLQLYELSNYKKGEFFIRWLSNLSIDKINSLDISKYDKENIINVCLKLTPKSFRNLSEIFEFEIEGVIFEENLKENSKSILIGDILDYDRDYLNTNDPYIIKIHKNGFELGFVPREYSKVISAEIDIEEGRYEIVVDNLVEHMDYNTINVSMLKIV